MSDSTGWKTIESHGDEVRALAIQQGVRAWCEAMKADGHEEASLDEILRLKKALEACADAMLHVRDGGSS